MMLHRAGRLCTLLMLTLLLGFGATVTTSVHVLSENLKSNSALGNPVDDSPYFVRQQYLDFLGREHDGSGFEFWRNNIESCGSDVGCREVARINTSASFFLSIEFQETGYLVYRAYKTAFGNLPGKPVPLTRAQFLSDVRIIGNDVIVLAPGWEQLLDTNKTNYFERFVATQSFVNNFPSTMSNPQLVDALNLNAGNVLSSSERDALIGDLNSGRKTRGQVLRAVAEDEDMRRLEFNRAFVLMEYFGYLRRDPDAAPNTDFTGYQFWLSKLDQFGGNYIAAEMVKAFLSSDEYRARFDSPPSLGSDKWQQDLQFLATNLPRLHLNAFTKITQAQFNQAVSDLQRDIPSLQDHQIVVRLMQIVAMIGDTHTNLRITGSPSVQFKTYPLELYWFKEGLYVTAASAPYKRTLGARVVRIGNTGIDQAYALVASLISHENDPTLKTFSPDSLVTTEELQALGMLPDLNTGHFVFRKSDGSEFSVEMAPVNRLKESLDLLPQPDPATTPLPSYRKQPELNYWFEYLDQSRTLYFQYNLCQNMAGLPFTQFTQNLFNAYNSHPIDRVVIDMRKNPGGSTALLQPIIDALRNEPSINQPGRLFVVIGRGTFSSAMNNAIDFDQRTNATLIGEPTGGKPNSFGEIGTLKLPNSGLTVSYSTKLFNIVVGDPLSLNPNVAVDITSTDFFAGVDPVMRAILNP